MCHVWRCSTSTVTAGMDAEQSSPPADEPPLQTVQVTAHEKKLLDALRAFPNRVEMWVGRGDPMKSHKRLLDMYARFFEIANAHGVEYWLEYGSVLGYVRHGGMIPWEWDMDIGCTPENFAKLKAIGEVIEATDPNYGFKYYRDPDYESAAYCFYAKADDNCLCDIAEYREDGDLLHCVVEDWHYPPHKKSVILPPKRVTMLGNVGMIPARSDVFLAKSESILGQCTGDADESKHIKNTIPYMQYDPIPFLLCHMFHPGFAELSCGPPVVDIPVAASIAEGFAKYARANLPFIVKAVPAFEFNYDAFRSRECDVRGACILRVVRCCAVCPVACTRCLWLYPLDLRVFGGGGRVSCRVMPRPRTPPCCDPSHCNSVVFRDGEAGGAGVSGSHRFGRACVFVPSVRGTCAHGCAMSALIAPCVPLSC